MTYQMADFNHLTLDSFISGRAYHKEQGHVNHGLELPEVDKLVQLLGGRKETKAKIKRVLEFHLHTIGSWGIFGRVLFDSKANDWEYCAGQDYPSELAYIRKLILKGA